MMLKLWKVALATFVCLYCIGITRAAPKKSLARATDDPVIESFHVQSLVISRYAFTTIVCKIANPSTESIEALFSVLLPVNAFISNLTIETGGFNYTSRVQKKEDARRTYETARVKGKNAAIVHQKERETSRFRVDVSIAAEDEVIIYLSYEELLERILGKYTLRINVHPNYIVKDVMVDVTIHETRPISHLEVIKVPGGEDFFGAVSEWKEGNLTARIQFDPDPGALPEDEPLHGQLVIEYDVKRALDAGDVQIEDGYFVHFFAPIDLQHTPKYITFLIDTSGSMFGTKIRQVKDALRRILHDLNKGDYFSITEFNDNAHKLIDAPHTSQSVKKAFKIIDNLQADGGTNIDHGLEEVLATEANEREGVMSHIIILLTDGQPTSGVQNSDKILKNARERNRYRATIFCLGFGGNADMKLLEMLSYQNGGFTRKIYEDIDAADQLQDFYKGLSSPLLLDVNFAYYSDDINMNAVTKTNFQNYFMGTELVVAGQIRKDHRGGVRANITGQGRNGKFTLGVTEFNTVSPPDRNLLDHLHLAPTPRKFIKRLWAFLMVKELLNKDKAAVEKKERILARQRAVQLALQYHFVTPLTSLVVVQPESQRCKDYDDEESDEDYEDVDLRQSAVPTVDSRNFDSAMRAANGGKQGLLPAPDLSPKLYDHHYSSMDHGTPQSQNRGRSGKGGKGRGPSRGSAAMSSGNNPLVSLPSATLLLLLCTVLYQLLPFPSRIRQET